MRTHVMFCGVGGSTEGAVRAGLDVRGAIDGWPVAVEAHRRWHPTIAAVIGRCEDACDLLPEPVDLVWASPSCKPYSTANRSPRRGKDHPEYYPLSLLVEQAIDRWHARWLVIENVGGLVWSREGKEEMARLAATMRARPGLTWTTTIVRASEHGVRQIRRRPIIVVGPVLVPILAGIPGAHELAVVGAPIREGRRFESRGVSRQAVTCAMDGGGHPGPSRARELARRERAVRGGGRDSHAYAKRAVLGPHGKGHDPRTGEVNYVQARTLAECAEIQQIPLAILDGLSKTDAHRLVGNAVPSSMAEWVCRCVLAADARYREVSASSREPPAPR